MRLAGGTLLQRLDFGGRHVAPIAALEIAKWQCVKLNADQLADRMTECVSDTPNLTLAALAHGDANPGRVFVAGQDFEIDGLGWAVVKYDSAPPDFEYLFWYTAEQRH